MKQLYILIVIAFILCFFTKTTITGQSTTNSTGQTGPAVEITTKQALSGTKTVANFESIQTIQNFAFELDSGRYIISLNVWLGGSTTVKGFYTGLTNPNINQYWGFDTLSSNKWVKLAQNFILNEDAQNAGLKIMAPNNPAVGGGSGEFYIDDISIVEDTSTSNIHSAYIPELNYSVYPNPVSDILNVSCEVDCEVTIYDMAGNIVWASSADIKKHQVEVSGYSQGLYMLKLRHKTGYLVKQIIIQ